MKIAFHTLGCKVNQHDTQSIAGLFRAAGHQTVPFEAGADVYVINTCAVTKVSEQKSRQIIRKGIDYNPEAIVVVTGCYAQTAPQEIAGLPGVNLVVGVADRPKLVELVAEFSKNYRNQIKVTATQEIKGWQDIPVIDSLDRTRATLKVQDGCEQFCAYCIIPYARGKVRSMPIPQAIAAYSDLVSRGFREIVLTGIHLGQYGKDLGIQFHDLFAELLKIDSNCRVRLGSLEPKDITPQLLALVINNPKVCQHLHIPLQSGSDHILERMKRNYDLAYYGDLLTQIRKQNPLLSIGTDLIVGFPGESERDFENTCSFLQAQNFSRVHVFRFSPRYGTPAASFPDRVAKGVQEERSRAIQKIADNSAGQYAGQFTNRTVEVLFEEKVAGAWSGLSGEYLRVTISAEHDLKNALRMVRIQGQNNDSLIGSLIDS